MPGKAAKVWITERQQPILRELSKSLTESQLVVQRATIVLRAFAGQLNEQIAVEIGLGPGQVGVWRRRWQAAWEELTALECREPRRLREAIQEVFRDAPWQCLLNVPTIMPSYQCGHKLLNSGLLN